MPVKATHTQRRLIGHSAAQPPPARERRALRAVEEHEEETEILRELGSGPIRQKAWFGETGHFCHVHNGSDLVRREAEGGAP